MAGRDACVRIDILKRTAIKGASLREIKRVFSRFRTAVAGTLGLNPGTHHDVRTLFATFGPKGPNDSCSEQKFRKLAWQSPAAKESAQSGKRSFKKVTKRVADPNQSRFFGKGMRRGTFQ